MSEVYKFFYSSRNWVEDLLECSYSFGLILWLKNLYKGYDLVLSLVYFVSRQICQSLARSGTTCVAILYGFLCNGFKWKYWL